MTYLIGDLGGTKTLLALFSEKGEVLCKQRFASRDFPDCESMVDAFLSEIPIHSFPSVALIAVAGPVAVDALGDSSDITNLPYGIRAHALVEQFGFSVVRLVNDFCAVAQAVAALAMGVSFPGITLHSLNPSAQPEKGAPLAILGAGTGLGEAIVAFEKESPVILSTEGGHADFAPQDELELSLFRSLLRKYPDHVSVERVVCGSGIVTLYDFLRDEGIVQETESVARVMAQTKDPAQVISAHALKKSDLLCELAFDRFVRLYAAEAGNLALKTLARGGVYLAGGIAAKNVPLFEEGRFLSHFVRKGRFTKLLSSFPIFITLGDDLGLFGAFQAAKSLFASTCEKE